MNMPSARITCLACMVVLLSGCATWTVPTDSGDALLRARAVTEAGRGVEVSATVLGPEDSIRMLGTNVNAAGVQPVWIEVRNDTEHMLWLLRAGADPDYFSPLEVAWSAHVKLARDTNARIDEHFSKLAFPNPIPAHGTSSGILYTNPQPVVKLLTVDLLGSKMMIPFTLFLPVPGDIVESVIAPRSLCPVAEAARPSKRYGCKHPATWATAAAARTKAATARTSGHEVERAGARADDRQRAGRQGHAPLQGADRR